MNSVDAKQLLAYACSFDNRKPSDTAADAFADALSDIPYDDDCRAAIALYYGTSGDVGERRWLQPHHVRTIRASIRTDRITGANALYPGFPDEGPAEFIERRRRQLAAAAQGYIPPTPIRAALTGPPHRTVAAAVRGVGQYVPPEARAAIDAAIAAHGSRLEQFPELAIACPIELCRAPRYRRCRRASGQELTKSVHPSRSTAWTHQLAQPRTDTA